MRHRVPSNEANNSAVSASPLTTFMKITSLIVFAASALLAGDLAAQSSSNPTSGPRDPGGPPELFQDGPRLTIYQPQVDDWKNFQELTWRMAVSLTPK